MKAQTKTTRVRVLRPFYLTRDDLAQVGQEIDLDTYLAGAMINGGKAARLTPSHMPVAVPPPAPSEFRLPDTELRATTKGKKP